MIRLAISFFAVGTAVLALPALAQESVLYSFTPQGDGNPGSRLLLQKNALFGTTTGNDVTDGTVFELKKAGTSWTESKVFTFSGSDGAYPVAGLIADAGGNLYGTTLSAGTYNGGTLFELSNVKGKWKEQTLWYFGNTATSDGAYPACDLLIDSSGAFFGTTKQGGTNNLGTVFRLTQSGGVWTDTVLYNFAGGSDGQFPEAGLVMDGSGALYGTTIQGGTSGSAGTVFALKPNGGGWTESVLHAFGKGTDGVTPGYGPLILASSGALYGTTAYGGTDGWGTVYQLTPSSGKWKEKVLYDFTGGADGAGATGGLIADKSGAMFGTTVGGGANFGGVVYTLAKSNGGWTQSVVTNFAGYSGDGAFPVAGVVLDKKSGTLYGVTQQGGNAGWGTVYQTVLP